MTEDLLGQIDAAEAVMLPLSRLKTHEAFQPRFERIVPLRDRGQVMRNSGEHIDSLSMKFCQSKEAQLDPIRVAQIAADDPSMPVGYYVVDGHHRVQAYPFERRHQRLTLFSDTGYCGSLFHPGDDLALVQITHGFGLDASRGLAHADGRDGRHGFEHGAVDEHQFDVAGERAAAEAPAVAHAVPRYAPFDGTLQSPQRLCRQRIHAFGDLTLRLRQAGNVRKNWLFAFRCFRGTGSAGHCFRQWRGAFLFRGGSFGRRSYGLAILVGLGSRHHRLLVVTMPCLL